MRLLIAGLAVALVGVTAWFGLGPGAGPPVGGCTTVAPATAAPSDDRRSFTATWGPSTVIRGDDEFDEEQILDVAAFREGFVAVGTMMNGASYRTFFRTSDDGEEWQSAIVAAGFEGSELRRLRVVGERIFAIGSRSTDDRGGSAGAIWISEDGIRWRPSAGTFGGFSISALAGDADRLLAIGAREPSGRPVAWRSSDGETWTESALRLPVDPGVAFFSDLARTAEGWLAVGFVSRGPDSASAAVAWTSPDGETWSCEVLGNDLGLRTHASELHRGPRGWLVVGDASPGCGWGSSCIGYQMVWSSVDGGWTDGSAPGAASDAVGESPMQWSAVYAPAPSGFVAVGGGLWVSDTGVDWSELDGVPPAGAQAVAVNGRRIVAGGTVLDAAGHGDAWLASTVIGEE